MNETRCNGPVASAVWMLPLGGGWTLARIHAFFVESDRGNSPIWKPGLVSLSSRNSSVTGM